MTIQHSGGCGGGKMRSNVGENTVELGHSVDSERLRPSVHLHGAIVNCRGGATQRKRRAAHLHE
jgi:hypothetical protein